MTFIREILKKSPYAIKTYEQITKQLDLSRSLFASIRNYKVSHSYSQCGKDLIEDHVVKHYLTIAAPSHLDIGAHHSTYLSNAYLFYERGCRRICVEPDPDFSKQFVKKDRRISEVFCIETLTYAEDKTERKIPEIANFIRDMGYYIYADTYINTIFIEKEA
jgi:hypothetical protein